MKKVAIYCRCSTVHQNVDMQIKDLRDFCDRQGYQIIEEFIDEAHSGSIDSRPSLNHLMSSARKRKFEVVLVWRFDRFGRSLRHLVTTLEELQHLNIGFISYSESIDTTSPSGKLMFSMVASFAEFERNILRERVCGGLRNAVRNGKKLGRPKRRDDVGIQHLRNQGISLRQIANQLNISLGAVQRGVSKTPQFMV